MLPKLPQAVAPLLILVLCGITASQTTQVPRSDFHVALCGKTPKGHRPIGWGKYGLHFQVPKDKVQIGGGKPDVDYVLYVVKPRKGDGLLQLWFGPNAMPSEPDPKKIAQLATVAQSKVVNSDGNVVGVDSVGYFPDGREWREFVFGHDGAIYDKVSSEDAALFNKIVDSACVVLPPN